MILSFQKRTANKFGIQYTTDIPENYNPLFFWYGAVKKTEHGEEVFILINEKTRFIVIVPKINEQEDIEKAIVTQIKKTLEEINLDEEAIDYYIQQAPDLNVVGVADNRIKSWLTKQAKEAIKMIDYCDSDEQENFYQIEPTDVTEIGATVSVMPQNSGYDLDKPFIPRCEMFKEITLLKDPSKEINDEKNIYEIKCSLQDSYVKTILIHKDSPFSLLSSALLYLFGFPGNIHLHAHEVFSTNRRWDPNVVIGMYRDDLDYGEYEEYEHKTLLKSHFENVHHIDFLYDLGDSWTVRLTLRRRLSSFNDPCSFLPFLLSMKGSTPVTKVLDYYSRDELLYALKHPEYREDDEDFQDVKDWFAVRHDSWEDEIPIPHGLYIEDKFMVEDT